MSYTRHNWENGEVITEAKMNNIEDGIEASGYDAVVSYYKDDNSTHSPVITILSGTFASLASKISEHIAPVILVKVWDELNYVYTATTAVSLYYFPTASEPNRAIVFRVKAPTVSDSYQYDWRNIMFLAWTYNDVIEVD